MTEDQYLQRQGLQEHQLQEQGLRVVLKLKL